MASEGTPTPAPVVLRIKVRYEQVEAFVERFAPYVGRAGLFLRSKVPKAVGTEVRFELRLSTDAPVLVGMGVVRWSRVPDPDRPYVPPGMAIEFTRVTKESRGVILQMLELRKKLGMADGPRGMPNPPDDDVAVTAATTASATAVAVAAATAPAAPAVPAPAVPAPVSTEPSAPRSTWQRPAVPAGLDPLIVKPRRPSAAELVSAMTLPASGAIAMSDAFGELEAEQADLPGVLARARALAGDDADAELAQLLDDDAAPTEITIEEASSRLASLLGTSPVRSRRPRGDDSVPRESKPVFVAPPRVAAAAATIASDFVTAPSPSASTSTSTSTSTAAADGADASLDPERTKVVSLDTLAALTAAPGEGETRVFSLEALAAATAVRDPDERTQVRRLDRAFDGDDARTKVISTRAIAPPADEGEETLDFDRPRPSSSPPPIEARGDRDDEPETDQDTEVKPRPLPASALGAAPGRPQRRTTPPPAPRSGRPSSAPPPLAARHDASEPDDAHDDDLTPPPLSPGRAGSRSGAESSGSIDITDLVAELEAETAEPVPIDGRSLGGEALDAAGLIADLDGMGRRRTPDGPFPDLASFANPPSQLPRPQRAETLESTLSALEHGDDAPDDGEERTSLSRPASHSGARPVAPPAPPPDDDGDDGDDLEIEIELDD